MSAEEIKKRKPGEEIGLVVSDKMDKTIVITVGRRVMHPLYKKYMTKTKRIKAHDEKSSAKVGDQVLIVQTKPISKEKRYSLKKILRQASV